MRVLDLDLDFFLHDKAHFMDGSDERLNPENYPPWPLDLVMSEADPIFDAIRERFIAEDALS
jgi:hypothetical protein